MYPGRVVIPKPVYDELSRPGISHLKERLDTLIHNGQVRIEDIQTGTETYDLYYQLAILPATGHAIIGAGEAASIALAKTNNGIVASNNLKDVMAYVLELGLKHITTGEILADALNLGYITELEGNKIWAQMIAKRRKLGAASFTDYLRNRNQP
jgi:predicted nucleic acid-binding protein